MSTITPVQSVTPEDLLAMPDAERYELVDGELRERDMSGLSSVVGRRATTLLGNVVDLAGLGYVAAADCGYRCFPWDAGKMRRPDGSFIAAGRLTDEELEAGYLYIPPDIAIEVVSPNDLAGDLHEKIEEYLRVSVTLVWVIDPRTRTVDVYRPDGSVTRLREADELTGEAVVPGFRCRVSELFPPRVDQTCREAAGNG